MSGNDNLFARFESFQVLITCQHPFEYLLLTTCQNLPQLDPHNGQYPEYQLSSEVEMIDQESGMYLSSDDILSTNLISTQTRCVIYFIKCTQQPHPNFEIFSGPEVMNGYFNTNAGIVQVQ